jgi:hypothetical protein
MPLTRRTQPAQLQALEGRTLLSGPSPREQQMLELVNRLRTHPAQELPLLLNSKDPDVVAALKFFKVDKARLAKQWANLRPVQPLAWNDDLAQAALTHTQKMLGFDEQSHQLPGEGALLSRVNAAGYSNAAFVGENVFAFMGSIFDGHAGFAIDWGDGPGGLQSPAGHRDNLMAGVFDEVGMSVVDGVPGKSTGPLLITEDFGARRNQRPFMLGVVYDDKNHDGAYTPGEGVAGQTIVATGVMGTYVATTQSAGGYQVALPPGTYKVTSSGTGIRGLATYANVVVNGENVKRDFTRPDFAADAAGPGAKASAVPASVAGGATSATFNVTFLDNAAVNASTLSTGDVRVVGPGGFVGLAQLVSIDKSQDGPTRSARYRFTAPGGFFDSADNGAYALQLQPNQVADINGNFAAPLTLGTIRVAVPCAVLAPGGTLVVNGTPGNDSIALAQTAGGSGRSPSGSKITRRGGGTLTVRVNRTRFAFDAFSVRQIVVNALGGNDAVAIGAGVGASRVDAGAGNDTVVGGAGADTLLGGDGNDLIYGNAGVDRIDAGAGRDRAKGDPKDRFRAVELLFA